MPYYSTEVAPPDEADKALKLLLKATQAGNHPAFIAPGTSSFQKGISKAMFDSVSRQVASRLKEGYTAEYLAEIKQGEFRVFVWKMSFNDRGYEFIARLAMTLGNKVAGFLLN